MITETIQYDSFTNFSNDVIPNNIINTKYEHFAFRGESSDHWKLLPQVLREDIRGKDITSELEQIRHEFSVISNFYNNANKNGLYLPVSQTLSNFPINLEDYDLMFEILRSNTYPWLPSDMIEVAALAQHYGLPTRMLDFSFSIFTALYFASYEACRKFRENHNGNIVIWAIDFKTLSYLKYTENKIPINFSVPIYANNPNLNAQKGLFTYWETILNKDAFIRREHPFVDLTPIDIKLNDYKSEKPLLYKFLIPKKDCIEIFDSLYKLDYHAATLFPGYSGITRMLKEKVLLDQLKH